MSDDCRQLRNGAITWREAGTARLCGLAARRRQIWLFNFILYCKYLENCPSDQLEIFTI